MGPIAISRKLRPDTITIYNLKSVVSGVAQYQRTVIKMVCLNEGYGQYLSQRGISTDDSAKLVIDNHDFDAGGRTFIDPTTWSNTLDADKVNYFTFGVNDFAIKGEVVTELPPFTKVDMTKQYRCLAVSQVLIANVGTILVVILK